MRIDIICRVIDNFGDAGFTWRLAQRLSQAPLENHFTMPSKDLYRVFCDQPEIIYQLAGAKSLERSQHNNLHILPWSSAAHVMSPDEFPDVILETFSCGLPETYQQQLQHRNRDQIPLVINIEYLSAEAWTNSHHGLRSLSASAQEISRYFYFPGLTSQSGGVLAGFEAKLTHPPDTLKPFWEQIQHPVTQKISIFNYAGDTLAPFLSQLQSLQKPITCLICAGLPTIGTRDWLKISEFCSPQQRDYLQLIPIPFIPQEDYDWLLLACDLNWVRGEDSFVRAQFAGKPFIWDIYPQTELVHQKKLAAFLDIYWQNSPKEQQKLGRLAMQNGPVSTWWNSLDILKEHAITWQSILQKNFQKNDLADRLRTFMNEKLKQS